MKLKDKCSRLTHQFNGVQTVSSLPDGKCKRFFVKRTGGDWVECCEPAGNDEGMMCRPFHEDARFRCSDCDGDGQVCLAEGMEPKDGRPSVGSHRCINLGE